ncbi:splicing factor, arginine/serine-rich 19 [Dunckerocampus dactyliophorus]|uniref:splicing factor, arginine/serine-rich 19 n=1 Tax=Dunckerocampus dactyliophorus TaxID=161453 RepID=UPI0024073D1C|nr:splicing factor, arginine/serine-rich 19 [Dunckerocampus dactyliophorus]
MDLTSASGLKRRLAAPSSPISQRDITRSPPRCSPSFSRSSPSPDRSSPSSTSSSACANSSVFQNHVKGQTRRAEVAMVSSTSAPLAMSSLAPSMSTSTLAESFPRTVLQSTVDDDDEESRNKEIYDPFHPTEGEKDVNMEEDEGEKYDPFDPTGSPASDGNDESDKMAEDKKIDEEKEEPPDSTDIFTDPPSPPLAPQVPHRRRVDYSTTKARGHRADSENSEIEEGEIVVAIERDISSKRTSGEHLTLNSPKITFFDPKPERILRVLDGDGFVSVCADGHWEEPVDEPVVGVEDLRRKLVSKRKERYLSCPGSSPLSSQPPPPPLSPPVDSTPSPLAPAAEQGSRNRKSSKSSKDQNRHRSKERKARDKDEKRKKRRKDKDGDRERSREKKQGDKTDKEGKSRRNSRSSSRKRKRMHHSSPEASQSRTSSRREGHSRHSLSSPSAERHRDRDRDKERDRGRDRDKGRDRDRKTEPERQRESKQNRSRRRDERDRSSSSRKDERKHTGRYPSSSRERDISKRSRRSRERRDGNRDRQRERRDGRPVVPPSIQDLNGSDLFAIKRTITVTTTTTTTTVPGSPILTQASPCRTAQDTDKLHKRKKKRRWHSGGEEADRGPCHSRSQSLSPPRYHSYESDRYSDKLEIDMLSLDGEALDSDYPSLEDTPPPVLPPDPPAPSPKSKTTPKTERHRPKKKGRTLKKVTQSSSSSSSSNKTKSKCLSSLSGTTESAPVSSGLPLAKRNRKVGKDKAWDKGTKKDLGRTSKKKDGSSRKSKLQSKVSVLVREGVSSTTGTSVGSGKLGMDLLGSGGTGGGSGGSVVGGSIAVVFCRDNESRSPFLKPCSEPLSVGVRAKDLASMGKRNSLAAPPPSLNSPLGLKSKKTKPGSITSTSSSTSSPSSTLATKRRRRLAKKVREKGGTTGTATEDAAKSKAPSEGWTAASLEGLSAGGDGSKSVSPLTGQAGPVPCLSSSSSSSSFTSLLPPSSSPPHTPPPSMAPMRDTRESSPDSQTVDSSCKTPEQSFLAEDCPTQTSPPLPPSSPASTSVPQGAGLSITLSTPSNLPPLSDNAPKSVASPPSSSSSLGGGLASLSLPLSSSDPSSSSSVSSSSASKPPPPPPPAAPVLPWSLQTGVDCTTGGVLALTALLFKMEEANIASRAKAQEFIQATSQILSQANQNQSQPHAPPPSGTSTSSSQIPPPPPPSLPPPHGLSPAQFILQSSLPLVGCTKTPPSHLHPTLGSGCAQTPPPMLPVGLPGTGGSRDTLWDNESKDPDKYLKKLHTQERAVEEVKLAIKPYYQRKDINKDEYKDILRKAVHKICHSRTGEINPVKVSNLVKLYVQRYKYFRKHGRKMDEEERDDREQGSLHSSA